MAKNVLSFLGLTATVEVVTKIEVFLMARGGSFMKNFFIKVSAPQAKLKKKRFKVFLGNFDQQSRFFLRALPLRN